MGEQELCMISLQGMTGGFGGMLYLGTLLAVTLLEGQAGRPAARVLPGQEALSDTAQPGAPTVRWRRFSPRVFTDKSPAINERAFAPPFVDQGPSMADQPLALIGDKPEGAPASQEGFKGPLPLHFIE